MSLKDKIRTIPNFPEKGVLFRDITTLLKDPEGLREAIKEMASRFKDKEIKYIVAIESRGFIFGAALAYELGIGFIPIRKPGKLPAETISETYDLEYGTDTIEMHKDAIEKDDKVLLFDDLLATGGTAKAACKLIEKAGGIVEGIAFVIELTGSLHGRDKLEGYNLVSLVEIPVEE